MKNIYSIVVTYNGLAWIEKCLNSLGSSLYPVVILVIDNGSTDGTVSFIRDNFPMVQVIETGSNLGFGQANNVGLEKALKEGADFVFLLNQDAYVEPGTIGVLVQTAAAHPSFGILSPIHLNGRGDAMDAYFQQYFMQSFAESEREGAPATVGEARLVRTEFVNAAAWLISAECLRETGGFDPLFFHYGEDDQYVQRALFRGFGVGIFTGTHIRHDRETRTSAVAADPAQEVRREWMQILRRACDIRRPGYRVFMIRRSARHWLYAARGLLSLNMVSFRHHMSLAGKTMAWMGRIGRCRLRALRGGTLLMAGKREAVSVKRRPSKRI